jgi:hypothetical protein
MAKIIVERGETTRMAKLFGCSGQAVRNALRYLTEGEYRVEIFHNNDVIVTGNNFPWFVC